MLLRSAPQPAARAAACARLLLFHLKEEVVELLRGSEDLGAGLSAAFHLKHDLLLDSGTPASSSLFWDRRATVSLAARPWGELRAAFGSGLNTMVRASNSLQWLPPADLGRLEGGLMLAAGEGGTAASGQHKVSGARLGWWRLGRRLIELLRAPRYTRSKNHLTGINALDDWALGYVHDMSKRSALSATASTIRNRGGASYSIPGGASGLSAGLSSSAWEQGCATASEPRRLSGWAPDRAGS